MAITANNLTSTSTVSAATSFVTASISPASDNLILLTAIGVKVPGSASPPSVSGNGLTWVHIRGTAIGNSRVDLFRAMGSSPSSGGVTVNYGADSQLRFAVTVDEFDGVDTSGTNGSGAVVQTAETSERFDDPASTTLTVTLGAFSSADNATYGGLGRRNSNTVTPGTGFTELAEATNAGGVSGQSEWRDDNDTTVTWSYSSTASDKVGFGVEIKAEVVGGAWIPKAITI